MIKFNAEAQGFDSVKRRLQEKMESVARNEKVKVAVGFQHSARNQDGESYATIAKKLNYGDPSSNIPPRPFMYEGIASGMEEYKTVMASVVHDGTPLFEAMDMVGQLAVGSLQQYMVSLKTPPNSPVTIQKKGSANPLVDTGGLVGSVNYSLEMS